MEVKYPIEDGALMNHLDREYGLRTESLRFIPMGDSAYSYSVVCVNGDRHYLKLFDRRNERQMRSVERLPYYLPLTWRMYHEGLFGTMTYPILNRQGLLHATFDQITTVLFNYIEGETLADAYPFSQEMLEEVAKSMAAIHRITPFIDKTDLLADDFDISFGDDLERWMSVLANTLTYANPVQQALRDHIMPKREEILGLLELLRKLRIIARTTRIEQVLCHGDMWGGNLIRHNGELHVIDWETAIIAPPELDWFGYIGDGFETFIAAYEKHAGQAATFRPDVIRFYAYRHHLRNLTNWLQNILYRNTEEAQNENDLDMILHHCMGRWASIEPNVAAAEAFMRGRK